MLLAPLFALLIADTQGSRFWKGYVEKEMEASKGGARRESLKRLDFTTLKVSLPGVGESKEEEKEKETEEFFEDDKFADLEILNLKDCDIGDTLGKNILKSLRRNTGKLRVLDLSGNDFTTGEGERGGSKGREERRGSEGRELVMCLTDLPIASLLASL